MRRLLIGLGLALLTVGLLWPWLARLGLGRLPGDLLVERENLRLYLPLATCLVVSALARLLIWLLRR